MERVLIGNRTGGSGGGYGLYVSKANSSVYAANAKVYIEAIEMNRQSLNEGHSDKADYVQLIYILSNLTYWRGVNSKESRKALKDYSESISGGS